MTNIQIARWNNSTFEQSNNSIGQYPHYILDTGAEIENLRGCNIVAPTADSNRVETLLSLGAAQVFIGETLLADKRLISGFIERFGTESIGVWMPVRLSQSHWELDKESNADFTFVAVTNPAPRWKMLTNKGDMTDIDALSWVDNAQKSGCKSFIISVDDPQDEDLLACAEMSEKLGNHFCLNTESDDFEEIRFWIQYGKVNNILVPTETDIELLLVNLDVISNKQESMV